jgi:hypothetical protein
VRKGSITSSVVYPPAVFKLKDSYRFRSIGGTLAGAIAVALTAAAEYRREEHQGFQGFEEAREQICSGSFLRNFFQPSEGLRPLMDTPQEASDNKSSRC